MGQQCFFADLDMIVICNVFQQITEGIVGTCMRCDGNLDGQGLLSENCHGLSIGELQGFQLKLYVLSIHRQPYLPHLTVLRVSST